jgi:hypothetical protein
MDEVPDEYRRMNGEDEIEMITRLQGLLMERDTMIAKFQAVLNENISVEVKKFQYEDGVSEAYLKHPVFTFFAASIADMFADMSAGNYLETRMFVPSMGMVTITAQKESGKTPHQLRKEAEAERDVYRDKLEAILADIAGRNDS